MKTRCLFSIWTLIISLFLLSCDVQHREAKIASNDTLPDNASAILPVGSPIIAPDEEIEPSSPGEPHVFITACGNGIRNSNEQCDDGNDDNFDSCNNVCERPSCGNAVLEINEECDDGDNENGNGCSARCLFERCGNARIDNINGNIEQCDDGNLKAGDGCSRACTFERCGNSILDPGEQCDQGDNNSETGPCTPWCKFFPACPVIDKKM